MHIFFHSSIWARYSWRSILFLWHLEGEMGIVLGLKVDWVGQTWHLVTFFSSKLMYFRMIGAIFFIIWVILLQGPNSFWWEVIYVKIAKDAKIMKGVLGYKWCFCNSNLVPIPANPPQSFSSFSRHPPSDIGAPKASFRALEPPKIPAQIAAFFLAWHLLA